MLSSKVFVLLFVSYQIIVATLTVEYLIFVGEGTNVSS